MNLSYRQHIHKQMQSYPVSHLPRRTAVRKEASVTSVLGTVTVKKRRRRGLVVRIRPHHERLTRIVLYLTTHMYSIHSDSPVV